MLDTVIVNARIVDGTGAPAYMGEIGISDGRIVEIGRVSDLSKEKIDAEGQVVAPGFIDVHTHYDAQVFWDPQVTPSCLHGVTSMFMGHCGFSIAPLSAEAAPYLMQMLARVEGMPLTSLEKGVPWNWSSFGEYLDKLEGRLGINTGVMAGHSAIRRVVMGQRALGNEATPTELAALKAMLADCLRAGAMGFSTTISPSHNDGDGNPVPSRAAARDELIALAAVCGEFEGTSLEITPGVSAFSDAQKRLMADMSAAAGRPLNWNLLAPAVEDTDEFVENQLAATNLARSLGGEVVGLTAAQPIKLRLNLVSGFVFDIFEGWAEIFKLDIPRRIEAFRDPARRQALDRGAKAITSEGLKQVARWENLRVEVVHNPVNRPFEGLTVGEIAAKLKKTPIDAMLDVAIADELKTIFLAPTVGGDDHASWLRRGRIWADDRTIIGASDAGAHLDMIDSFSLSTHLLASGVRKYRVISLEQAIRQLTQVPANLYGLVDRGVIKRGWAADLVVFDPDTIECGPVYVSHDLPGNEMRLCADPIGISHVFVNGVETVKNGKHTGRLPGKILRSGVNTKTPALPLRNATFTTPPVDAVRTA